MGFWSKVFTWWNGATVGTALFTRRFGDGVGRDEFGNSYFQDKTDPARRWVIYSGDNDGSRVPPDWQLWLRGTIDDLPGKALPPVRTFQQQADAEPDRHHGRLPARWSARQRQGAAGFDRRLPAVDSRIDVGKSAFAILAVMALAACGKQSAEENASAPVISNSAAPIGANQPGVTPMAQRVAVLGDPQQAQWHRSERRAPPGPIGPLEGRDRAAARLRSDGAVGRGKAHRRLRPGRRPAPGQEMGAGLFGLALQGVAVAQRRRASGL